MEDKELLNTVNESEKSYARCKACDASFYPYWREEINQFEDLCNFCLQAIYTEEEEFLFEVEEIDDY